MGKLIPCWRVGQGLPELSSGDVTGSEESKPKAAPLSWYTLSCRAWGPIVAPQNHLSGSGKSWELFDPALHWLLH